MTHRDELSDVIGEVECLEGYRCPTWRVTGEVPCPLKGGEGNAAGEPIGSPVIPQDGDRVRAEPVRPAGEIHCQEGDR